MTPPRVLSPRQRRAIVALLSEPTIDAAAPAAGCGKRTILRWKAEDADFRAEFDRAGAETFHAALASLRALTGDAVAALRDVLRDPAAQAAARVAAAKAVLERADPRRGEVRAELRVTDETPEERAESVAALCQRLDTLFARRGHAPPRH